MNSFTENQVRQTIKDAFQIREESWIDSESEGLRPGKYMIDSMEAARLACVKNNIPHTFSPLVGLCVSEYGSVSNNVQAWSDGSYDNMFEPDGTYKIEDDFEKPVKLSLI